MKCAFCFLAIGCLSANAASDGIVCRDGNIPEGKTEMFLVLKRSAGDFALLYFKKTPQGQIVEEVLAKDLICAQAKSDFRVINCLRNNDATLTIIQHTYLSAGSVRDIVEGGRNVVSVNYRLYFRDDREPKREIDKKFLEPQCRVANAGEIAWAEGLLR